MTSLTLYSYWVYSVLARARFSDMYTENLINRCELRVTLVPVPVRPRQSQSPVGQGSAVPTSVFGFVVALRV